MALLPRRLEIFSEVLERERRELAAWGFAHAVLSACWDADMPGEWDTRALEFVRGLEELQVLYDAAPAWIDDAV